MNTKNIIFKNKKWIIKPNSPIFIYCWENQINNKKYIGQTRMGQKRLYDESSGCNVGPVFRNAILKYGINNFICYILEYCKISELNEKEQFWINFYQTTNDIYGYNIASGGQQYYKKSFYPIEQRDLQGKIIAIYDSYYEAAISIDSNTYINVKEDNIRKAISGQLKSAYGYKWNYQGQNYNKENNILWQKVAQYDLNGMLINTFPNIKKAAEFNNINYKNLWNAIKRPECLQLGGYMWRCYEIEPLLSIESYIEQLPYKIVEYDLNNNIIAQFCSIKEASETSGDSRTRISLCCNGHQDSTHGHRWKKVYRKELEI